MIKLMGKKRLTIFLNLFFAQSFFFFGGGGGEGVVRGGGSILRYVSTSASIACYALPYIHECFILSSA